MSSTFDISVVDEAVCGITVKSLSLVSVNGVTGGVGWIYLLNKIYNHSFLVIIFYSAAYTMLSMFVGENKVTGNLLSDGIVAVDALDSRSNSVDVIDSVL